MVTLIPLYRTCDSEVQRNTLANMLANQLWYAGMAGINGPHYWNGLVSKKVVVSLAVGIHGIQWKRLRATNRTGIGQALFETPWETCGESDVLDYVNYSTNMPDAFGGNLGYKNFCCTLKIYCTYTIVTKDEWDEEMSTRKHLIDSGKEHFISSIGGVSYYDVGDLVYNNLFGNVDDYEKQETALEILSENNITL